MRVLAMTTLYPNPLQPRRAPFNRHQLRLLGERCPVRVIAPIAWTDELRSKRACARKVTLDRLTVEHPRFWFPPRMLLARHGFWYRRSVCAAMERAIDEFQPTILFAPWAYPDGWAAVKLAKENGIPLVVQVHGSDIKLLRDYPSKRARTIEALTDADGVIAVSQDLANDVTALGAKNVKVIYDGVDPALFSPIHRKPDGGVLFIGNLVPVKNVASLIEAMQGIPAVLTIIGEGPLRESLESLAAQRGVKAKFLGSLPQEQLPAHYDAANVFVLPSKSEGVPNVLLEASACGTPWIASNVGGIPEIAHLGASRLVPPGDVSALAAAIREMLASPPTPPNIAPRLRTEAVTELHDFLFLTENRKLKTENSS